MRGIAQSQPSNPPRTVSGSVPAPLNVFERSASNATSSTHGTMTWLCRFLYGSALLPRLVAAQQPLVLQKPAATFPEPFTQIASIRELRDGRVLILDRRDRIVLAVDFHTGKSTTVGREGTGPGEYVPPCVRG